MRERDFAERKLMGWLKRKTWLGTPQILQRKSLKVVGGAGVVPPWQVHSWSILVASPVGLGCAQKGFTEHGLLTEADVLKALTLITQLIKKLLSQRVKNFTFIHPDLMLGLSS